MDRRRLLEELCGFDRGTGGEGERRAAEWVAGRLEEAGAHVRLEEAPTSGGYWWPHGVCAAAGVVAAGLAALGRRRPAIALGALAAAAGVEELPPRGRRLRRVMAAGSTPNVVGVLGPQDAPRTVVVLAHHDTAHAGLVFHPAIPHSLHRVAPGVLERANTSPPLMWPVVGAPAVVALAALTGSRALLRLGAFLSAGVAAAMLDIGLRDAVPGANDNGTGVVALIELARSLSERPPSQLRVMLVSTSEEATCEGMHHFAARHFPELPRERTFFLCLDTLGSPHLCVLRGEGMLGMRDYPPEALELLDRLAADLGIRLFPGLRLRNATDGVYPLFAGYACASIASCTDLKQPANYHWPTDVPENVDLGTLDQGLRLAEAAIRRLDERWLAEPSREPLAGSAAGHRRQDHQ